MQADIEIAEMREREAHQAEAAASRQAAGSDDEDNDETLARLRAQDDWRDTHPAGYGNSKLRPTA